MQTVGYDAAHFPPDGGGGGRGGGLPDRQAKPKTGWSSMPLRATPVCPCRKSKKATPTTRARTQNLAATRAACICLRRKAVAPAVQEPEATHAG